MGSKWEYVKFGDIVEIVTKKIAMNDISLKQYISTNNMLPDKQGVTTADSFPSSKNIDAFKVGDTLFSNIRTYFKKVWFATFDGGSSADVLVFRSKDDAILYPHFLYYLISSDNFIDYTNLTSKGAKMPRGDKSAILIYHFQLPPLKIQQKIAKVLSDLDKKIELNNQINEILEAMVQAIFKSWFIDFEPVKAKIEAKEAGQDAEGILLAAMNAISGKDSKALKTLQTTAPEEYAELKAIAEQFPDSFEESELGMIPKGWEVKKIEEIVERISAGKRYSQKNVADKGKVPVLDQGRSGLIGYHNDDPGVLANIDNPIIIFANHTCYMRLIMHDFSSIQNVLPFKGVDNLNIYWLYFATKDKQQFIEYKGHWPDLMVKQTIVPPKNITNLFGSFIKKMMINIFFHDKQNKTLTELRDTLLPKLLSGEIDVSNVEIDELLENEA